MRQNHRNVDADLPLTNMDMAILKHDGIDPAVFSFDAAACYGVEQANEDAALMESRFDRIAQFIGHAGGSNYGRLLMPGSLYIRDRS